MFNLLFSQLVFLKGVGSEFQKIQERWVRLQGCLRGNTTGKEA